MNDDMMTHTAQISRPTRAQHALYARLLSWMRNCSMPIAVPTMPHAPFQCCACAAQMEARDALLYDSKQYPCSFQKGHYCLEDRTAYEAKLSSGGVDSLVEAKQVLH